MPRKKNFGTGKKIDPRKVARGSRSRQVENYCERISDVEEQRKRPRRRKAGRGKKNGEL